MQQVFVSRSLTAVMFATIYSLTGCQQSSESFVLAPVEGRVVFESKPVADALVQFSPSKGPSSEAFTDADGQFTLLTNSGKGAVVGSQNVKVTTGLPRSTPAAPVSSSEPPKEIPLGKSPPTDYLFEASINVEKANNSIELDLSKAKKRRG